MRDKLVWKFLTAYVPLILLSVIVLNFFVSFSVRRNIEQKITDQLHGNSVLIGSVLQEHYKISDMRAIQEQVAELGQKLNLRITVIDKNGTVIGDSLHNPRIMENHGDRLEFIEAMNTGVGESKRFSETLKYNMQYLAIPFYQGQEAVGVIRLAMDLRDVDNQIRAIYRAVLLGGIIAAILMIVVGYFISRTITNPIIEMRDIAQRISNGDFSQKLNVKSKDELGSLAISFNRMANDLQAQIESLKRMDEVRTDFVANVSHELKTPLTSIKGYVETLQDGAFEDKKNAEKFLGIIHKNVDSLTNIVDDLLALSEVELGKDRLHKSPFNLKGLLDEVVMGLEGSSKGRCITFDCSQKEADYDVSADRGKIEQVFVNIIDNAVKYTEEGGQINISLRSDNGRLTTTFSDNGVGIPADELSRVFERFYRVDKARSREVGGTGLGLAIVKHIVSLHGGKVTIDSAINQGTKVTVVLPSAS